jgi:hypothetical protein
MRLQKKVYEDLDDVFKFDCEVTHRFKTYKTAETAANHETDADDEECWGKTNLMIPSKDIKHWFRLAAEGLSKNRRTVIVTPFNPHYMYWFEYVHPYASSVILYKHKFPIFQGYTKAAPKTICLVIFDPKQRKTLRPKKELYGEYVDGKYVYMSIPLKLDRKHKTS